MKRTKTLGVICCSLILGVANITVAADGDVHGGGSSFSSDQKMKAQDTPILWSVVSIPPDIVQGVEFQVDCVVEAQKNAQDAPQRGVKGSAASFVILLDVGSRTWDFVGLVGSGIPFTTERDGTSSITTGPVTAGAWANNPSDNDTISISATFTNNKKVQKTGFYCEVIVGG